MKELERETQRRLRVLKHAEECGNIRRTCRYFGLARSTFYRWKVEYEKYGEQGLLKKPPVVKHHPRTIPPEIVEKVLHLRRTYHLGPVRIVWYLARYHEIKISDASVYRILCRHSLNRLPRNVGRRKVHTKRYEKQVPGHHIQVVYSFAHNTLWRH